MQYQGGNVHIYNPHCDYAGGSAKLHVQASNFLYGSNINSNGMNASGLCMLTQCINYAIVVEDSQFIGNIGGNITIFLQLWSKLNHFTEQVIIKNCAVRSGSAEKGGGLHLSLVQYPPLNRTSCHSKHVIQVLDTTFANNIAYHTGGGMYYTHLHNFESYCVSSTLYIHNSTFTNNTRLRYSAAGGTALYVQSYLIPGYLSLGLPQALIKIQDCTFTNNYGGLDDVMSAALFVLQESSVSIDNCKFLFNNCTAITVVQTEVLFGGNNVIQGNRGNNGGGIVLCDRSHMYFTPYTRVFLADNTAREKGGAIYAEDDCLQEESACFFQIVTEIALQPSLLKTVKITLDNNIAVVAGNAVYGGSIDYCYLIFTKAIRYDEFHSGYLFDTIFHPHFSASDPSYISSDPIGVCLCDGTLVCSSNSKKEFIYPGQTLQVSAVTVGHRNGTVPGNVVATVNANASIKDSERVQFVPTRNCLTLNYTVFSSEKSASIKLNIPRQNDYYKVPVINLTLLMCPLGFRLVDKKCQCLPLQDFTISCEINNPSGPTIYRQIPEWIGYDHATEQILYYSFCPFDYCKPTDVNISTDKLTFNQDAQCAFNRTGVLCGRCRGNLSLILGSDNCSICSNIYLLLLIVFSLLGLLLVLVISVCNLTITDGTINSLVFYANVIQVSINVYFPALYKQTSLTGSLTVLIAWLNLDLGIETCFYSGLDAYAKTWLQFAFPAYLLVIAGSIVCLSRRITVFAHVIRRNGVQVLATLLYLSYTKLLHAAINALSFGFLLHSDGQITTVWFHDGNLRYLHGKHIPLFMAALVLGLLSLPFMLVLLFIQPIQRISNSRVLTWVQKLKPLIDAYTGPYKDGNRYWIGLLLFIRAILLIVHACNGYGDMELNPVVTAVICSLLLAYSWLFRGGPYKKRTLNALESLLILNLGILCIGTAYFNHHSHPWQKPFASTMVFLALVVFGGFLCHRMCRSLCSTFSWRRLVEWATRPECEAILQPVLAQGEETRTAPEREISVEHQAERPRVHAYIHSDEYREPLLTSGSSD